MSSCKVEFIQGSECSVTGKQITTLVCEYPRAIHSQLLTHKMFSKNSSSTRAVPINTAIQQIKDNPARPIWTENQSGMQGRLIVDPDKIQTIHKVVRLHMENTFSLVRLLGSSTIEGGLNVHKQNAGRYLEPFQNIRIVLTSTEWDNWDWLRNHKDAQPEIEELARAIYQARLFADSQKKYQVLSNGEYHVPFVDRQRDDKGVLRYFHPEGYEITVKEAIELSMSICAQTSYRKADTSKDKTDTVIERLFTGVKVHASPAEHQATPVGMVPPLGEVSIQAFQQSLPEGVTHYNFQYNEYGSGNFYGWIQQRQLIPNHDGKLKSIK